MTDNAKPAVFFDGACPLCRREIGMYKKRDGDGAIEWVDVSSCELAQLPAELSRTGAEARFHARSSDGQILSGAAAFAELWSHTDGFRWLGRIAKVPPITAMLEFCYRRFLIVRPAVQRWVRRMDERGQKPASD